LALKLFHTVLLSEFIDPASRIHNFLLTGEKWVTLGANLNVQVMAHGGASLETVAATAGHVDFVVGWVDFCFHD